MNSSLIAGTRKLAALSAVCLAAVLVLAGCGSDDDSSKDAGTNGDLKPARVAFITGSYTDFNQVEEQGMKQAIEPGGGSVKVFNSNFDPAVMQKQCQDVVTSGRFDAVIIESDPTAGPACVKTLAAGNLPAIQLDVAVGPDLDKLEPQVDGVVGSVVLSRQTNIENTVALVKKACEGVDPCKIVAEIIQPPDTFYGPAIDAVKKEVPNAEIVQRISGFFDPAAIAKAMPDVLSAHPDVNVFLSTADTQALAALPAIKQAGLEGKVKIIGNGGSRAGAKAVADGTLFGSQGNWPVQGGKAAGEMAIKAANGKPIEPNTINVTTIDSPVLLTKDTIDEFTPEWGAE